MFSHLRLVLPSGSFPSGIPTKILMHFSPPHVCFMHLPSHPPWFDRQELMAEIHQNFSFHVTSYTKWKEYSETPLGRSTLSTTFIDVKAGVVVNWNCLQNQPVL
jgi:hypothetical protein